MTNFFETFNNGHLVIPNKTSDFENIPWSKHPTFEGVELKHIVTSADTHGEFSYHLVRIAPNKSIFNHIHELQLETHEVIYGDGICINNQHKIEYYPGVISIMPKKIPHEVHAGDNGLLLFAKFIPALC
ncbi:MAG: cupin [Acutalibacteraceae bacterium]|nr:cupin [Acutalibacteraceae bacterium]